MIYAIFPKSKYSFFQIFRTEEDHIKNLILMPYITDNMSIQKQINKIKVYENQLKKLKELQDKRENKLKEEILK